MRAKCDIDRAQTKTVASRMPRVNADDLGPVFLLAAPDLLDSHFQRTVVLLGIAEDGGALGWTLSGVWGWGARRGRDKATRCGSARIGRPWAERRGAREHHGIASRSDGVVAMMAG